MKTPFRIRTKYIIMPAFQLRMAGIAVALACLQMAVVQFFVYRFSAALAVINLVVFVFVTHKIAGPMYRVRQTAMAWKEGKDTPLRLRKGDFFQEVAQELQEYKESVSKGPDKKAG